MDKIITISRQYSSGGREIAGKLAAHYGIPFYDNELISLAAKESGFAEAAFENAESRASSSLLYSIARGMTSIGGQEISYSNLSLD
ncbi:MAG: cytidylate kinase family protein, partial [Lachnospiraceae bacterium]|nr:cytidylate kinase family protein [Lachnospiraceae bacterium]